MTACYHIGIVDSGDRNAKIGHSVDTSVISRRVADVINGNGFSQIINHPVKVAVDDNHDCLGSLRVTVKQGDGQRECRLLTESIGRRVPANVYQLTYVTP